jgi:hypothetical protein
MLDQLSAQPLTVALPPIRKVVVPEKLRPRSPVGSPLPTKPGDLRRYVRFVSDFEAILQVLDRWPEHSPIRQPYLVPIHNISRDGLQAFHHEQLFPDDRIQLKLLSSTRIYRVVRCRRVTELCYELGVQIVSRAPTA